MSAGCASCSAIDDGRRRASRSAPASPTPTRCAALAAHYPDFGELLRRLGARAGPQLRHDRRQHRQRLADRRQPAGADRARRHAACSAAATSGASCRSRTSSSPTASRTGGRASSSRRSRVPQARGRARASAATRSPSASTRTSRRCCGGVPHRRSTDGEVADARIAFGGMAATPKRARRRRGGARSASPGPRRRSRRPSRRWREDFAPITDMRASAAYRAAGGPEPAASSASSRPRAQRRARSGCDAAGARPCLTASSSTSRGGVHQALAHDSAGKHVSRRGALHRRHARAGAARCRSIVGLSRPRPCADHAARPRRRCATAPGVVCVLTAADMPGDNDVSPAHARRRADASPTAWSSTTASRCSPSPPRRCRQARAAAAARRWSSTRTCRPVLDRRRGARQAGISSSSRHDACSAATRAAAIAAAPHRLAGRIADRRPGPLLPRGPGRAGRAGRGRRHASSTPRPSTPPRSSTWSPRVLGLPTNAVTVEVPPHGRRLRRQGDPGRPVRRDRGAGRRARPAGPPSAGSTATTT